MKKLVIAGGTGFIGTSVINFFKKEFDEIVVLTRSAKQSSANIRYVIWNAKDMDEWFHQLENSTVLLNLTGRSINCKHTEENKKQILESRVNSTRILGKAIQLLKSPPQIWINISATGIYKINTEVAHTEYSEEFGNGFMFEVCKQWENTMNEIALIKTKKIIIRLAIVLGQNGGVYKELIQLANRGMGGRAGDGLQKVSWIHINDLCQQIKWIINSKSAQGIYNAASPNPTTNQELMSLIRKAANTRINIPAPPFIIRLIAPLIDKEANLILDGMNVISQRSIEEGFSFEFDNIEKCITNLVSN